MTTRKTAKDFAEKVRQEETSAKVAALAGRILKALENVPGGRGLYHINMFAGAVCTVTELRSLAASCLTQAPDRKVK